MMKKDKHFDALNIDSLASMDDFDLALLGLGSLPQDEEPDEDAEPTISPYHDIDSLEFHLWMEEEVDKEAMRRLASRKKDAT